MNCTIQIYLENQWTSIATFEPFKGHSRHGYADCGGYLEHNDNYVSNFFRAKRTKRESEFPRISLPIPITFPPEDYNNWPAFLLDLLPTGAGRRVMVERMRLTEGPGADWELLLGGARHPVGWLRVLPGDGQDVNDDWRTSRGFTAEEVSVREQYFLEYMIEQGASIAGSSDVQGEAPKLLLTQDADGLFHADGALPDHQAKRHWLVKYSRSRTDRERQILRNECAYLHLAHSFGVKVHDIEGVHLSQNLALFVPRFDRECTPEHTVNRFGLESFASAAGRAEFGFNANHEDHCALLLAFSSSPTEDIIEYVQRDVLNVCMGNTDNHARNHAFRKKPGEVRLSPLYDFAPMFFSEEGIARSVRWSREKERMGQPNWTAVGTYLVGLKGMQPSQIAEMFASVASGLSNIEKIAGEVGIEAEVLNRRKLEFAENLAGLDEAANSVAKL